MTSPRFQKFIVSGSSAESLAWHGGRLIDPVGGWEYKQGNTTETLSIGQIRLGDGVYPLRFSAGYPFDANVCERIGGSDWMICYQKFGTKGVVFRNFKIVREIDRSFEHADCFEYPVALIQMPDGNAGIAHCPVNAYGLRIEDAETGTIVAQASDKVGAHYHSRLAVSPDLKRLIDHGWEWHPVQVAHLWTAAAGVVDLKCQNLEFNRFYSDFENATFDADGNIVTSQCDGNEGPSLLEIWDVSGKNRIRDSLEISPLGTMYCGKAYAYCLYDHLKVRDLKSGAIVQSWPEVRTGKQRGVISETGATPVHAFERSTFSIAVADGNDVHVIRPAVGQDW